ncbi:unnamed protein product [Urochloa humidicola]
MAGDTTEGSFQLDTTLQVGMMQDDVAGESPLEEIISDGPHGMDLGLNSPSWTPPGQAGPVANAHGEASARHPNGPSELDGPVDNQVAQEDKAEEERNHDNDNNNINSLFCIPNAAIAVQPPVRRPRQRRTFDMTAVRRSARLAKKPAMPAAERAQRNLWRKLGLADDELAPMEEVLKEFLDMFVGPLPEHIIAALTAIFDLEDDGADVLNEALLEHAGEGHDDLQVEAGHILA